VQSTEFKSQYIKKRKERGREGGREVITRKKERRKEGR
jgi:hypothetical protein